MPPLLDSVDERLTTGIGKVAALPLGESARLVLRGEATASLNNSTAAASRFPVDPGAASSAVAAAGVEPFAPPAVGTSADWGSSCVPEYCAIGENGTNGLLRP